MKINNMDLEWAQPGQQVSVVRYFLQVSKLDKEGWSSWRDAWDLDINREGISLLEQAQVAKEQLEKSCAYPDSTRFRVVKRVCELRTEVVEERTV